MCATLVIIKHFKGQTSAKPLIKAEFLKAPTSSCALSSVIQIKYLIWSQKPHNNALSLINQPASLFLSSTLVVSLALTYNFCCGPSAPWTLQHGKNHIYPELPRNKRGKWIQYLVTIRCSPMSGIKTQCICLVLSVSVILSLS